MKKMRFGAELPCNVTISTRPHKIITKWVRGYLAQKKLEERREMKKLIYGRRREWLEHNRLVKVVAEKVKDTGSIAFGWWEEYIECS